MASRAVHYSVAAIGITLASTAAWWVQAQPRPPQELASSGPRGAASSPAPAPAASGPRAPGVEVARVETSALRDDAQAVGTLRSRQSVTLRPEVAGRIAVLGFADGARVRKGQVLVQLDDTLQKAELSQAQAQVAIAQANFRRNQELVAQNFVAQRVLDESAAALQVAQAQLALAQARLDRMRIVAPFDATAGIRSVNIGDYVKDGADLVNLEDLSTMLVDFRLPERFLTRLRPGQSVEVQLDALPGRQFAARVEAIDPLIDANGRSVAVRASLPNTGGQPLAGPPAAGGAAGGGPRPAAVGGPAAPASSAKAANPSAVARGGQATPSGGGRAGGREGGGPLRAGMFARVTAVFAVREQALVVPEEAIVPQGGRQFVIKVVPPSAVPGTATAALSPDIRTVSLRQEVRLGIRRPGRVEILEGVALGDTVVVAGQQRLQRDGTPVRVVEAGRRGPPAAAGAPAGAASAPAVSASAAPAR